MVIDIMVYSLLKLLSWILHWIPPLPDWLIDSSYDVIDFFEELAVIASPYIAWVPLSAIRPMFAWTLTAVMILWSAGLVHRLVVWLLPGEGKGTS